MTDIRALTWDRKEIRLTDRSNLQGLEGWYSLKLRKTGREILLWFPHMTRRTEYILTMAAESAELEAAMKASRRAASAGERTGIEASDMIPVLEAAGWTEAAQQHHLVLRVLMPGKGGWGGYESEKEYIDEAVASSNGPAAMVPYTGMGSEYLYGEGAGGALLECWAAQHPLIVNSQCYADTANTPETLRELASGIVFTDDLSMIEYPDARLNTAYLPLKISEITVPTYAYNCAGSGYWSGLAETAARTYGAVTDDMIFAERPEPETVCRALTGFTRAGTDCSTGNVISRRAPAAELKAEGRIYENYDFEQVIGGVIWRRHYMVYVPRCCGDFREQQYPVIYFLAGGDRAGHVIFDQTDAWETAEKYGFIGVFPTPATGWNVMDGSWAPAVDPETGCVCDDFAFMDQLMDRIEADFNTDPGRVYVTGHSMGGIFTNYLGMRLGHRITAIGAVSGPVFDAEEYNENYSKGTGLQYAEGAGTGRLPAAFVFGERDNWPINIGRWTDECAKKWYSGQMNSRTGPMRGTRFNDVYYTYTTQKYWADRNGVSLDDHELAEQGLICGSQTGEQVPFTKETAAKRYTSYQWRAADGMPVMMWIQCAGRGHMQIPTDVEKLWTDWFSRFRRGDDGEIVFLAADAAL